MLHIMYITVAVIAPSNLLFAGGNTPVSDRRLLRPRATPLGSTDPSLRYSEENFPKIRVRLHCLDLSRKKTCRIASAL